MNNRTPYRLRPAVPSGEAIQLHNQLIEHGKSLLKIRPEDERDVERFITKALQDYKMVESHFATIDKEVRANGGEHNIKLLNAAMSKMLMETFAPYTHEELLMVLSIHFASLIQSKIV